MSISLMIEDYKKRVRQLENTLVTIEKMCDWINRDCQEADKVLCNTGSITFEIAKVYPKYSRKED